MVIEYRTGSLFDAPERHLVHGCNARGQMGAGIAKVVRATYPAAYAAYRAAHLAGGLRLGQVVWADCGRHVVGNAVTQDAYGNEPGVLYADYDAIRAAMAEVDREARVAGVDAVAMPLVGAGLAAGSWARISTIVEAEARHFRPVVYLLDGVVPVG